MPPVCPFARSLLIHTLIPETITRHDLLHSQITAGKHFHTAESPKQHLLGRPTTHAPYLGQASHRLIDGENPQFALI